jgi:hypothetical protein
VGPGPVSGVSDKGAKSADMALVSFEKRIGPRSAGRLRTARGMGNTALPLNPNIYLTLVLVARGKFGVILEERRRMWWKKLPVS